MSRQSRLSVVLAAAAGVLLLAASPAAEAADLGVRVGYYTEVEKPFVGGELLFRLGDAVYLNPNVEYVLVDHGHYLTANADVHYDFASHGSSYFWAGAGLGFVITDPDGPRGPHTDAAANFLVGIGLSRGPVVPYFQAKVIARDDSEFSVAFGMRF